MERKLDILQGTLDLMVLRTLATLGRQHGYSIASRLEQIGQGSLQLNMGTLYPALVRLEQRGLLRAKWGTTESNRRARFYEITPAGRKQMQAEREQWQQMAAIMSRVLEGEA
jgi:PadR family transcriptional regulator PadR